MELNYSHRLKLLHGICLAETHADGATPSTDLSDYDVFDAANYLASFITFRAIQASERQPAQEYKENFEMLSVYQAYGLLTYAFLTTPLAQENLAPDYQAAQIIIAKTLFAGICEEELAEIIDSGLSKVKLIGEADVEHWSEFRENLDKLTVSFVIAGTDDESPHSKEEVLPLFGQLLSQLCEAFEAA
ncbi:MAG: hypothetical protein ACKVOA_00335 [Methylophilaceae bacterium]